MHKRLKYAASIFCSGIAMRWRQRRRSGMYDNAICGPCPKAEPLKLFGNGNAPLEYGGIVGQGAERDGVSNLPAPAVLRGLYSEGAG